MVPRSETFDDTAVGSGDVFEVRVFGEDALSGSHRVHADGTIDYPLVGSTQVAGLQPPEIAALIAEGLRDGGYLIDPQVSVFVEEYASKQVSVLGAVSRPGTFQIRPGMTVVQAISLAGGFSQLANRNETRVTRRTGERVVRMTVRMDEVTSGRANDPVVRPGDVVFVPERVF